MNASGHAHNKSASLWGGRLRRLARRLSQRPFIAQGYVVRYPIDQQQDLAAPLPGLEVHEVTLADEPAIAELVQKYGTPMTLDRLRGRFARGKRCFTAWLDGQLVTYVWVSLDVIRVAHLYEDEPIPPDTMYLSDAHTLEEFRGCSIYPYLKTVVTRQVAAETGRTVVMSIILPHNQSSLHASRKLGGQPVLRRVSIGIFGWKFNFETRRKPHLDQPRKVVDPRNFRK